MMTVFCLGSINIDHVYRLTHLPGAGETIPAQSYAPGLGGKGANQSVAAARAGATVRHIGAVGRDGAWARDRLAAAGVDTSDVATVAEPTGHAIVMVDPAGENSIVIHAGANRALAARDVTAALAGARAGDILLVQNETNAQDQAVRLGRAAGMRVLYSAAPFDPAAVEAVLPFVDIVLLNAVEAAQLAAARPAAPPVDLVVTLGAAGAEWRPRGGENVSIPAFPATPLDTTGAGDCFAGVLAAALDGGLPVPQAIRRAAAAAAVQITRPGAADAMPTAAEIAARLAAG
jgi:ribokinase